MQDAEVEVSKCSCRKWKVVTALVKYSERWKIARVCVEGWRFLGQYEDEGFEKGLVDSVGNSVSGVKLDSGEGSFTSSRGRYCLSTIGQSRCSGISKSGNSGIGKSRSSGVGKSWSSSRYNSCGGGNVSNNLGRGGSIDSSCSSIWVGESVVDYLGITPLPLSNNRFFNFSGSSSIGSNSISSSSNSSIEGRLEFSFSSTNLKIRIVRNDMSLSLLIITSGVSSTGAGPTRAATSGATTAVGMLVPATLNPLMGSAM